MDKKLDLNLREWKDGGDYGPRFIPTAYECPRCRKAAWEDRWPQNHAGYGCGAPHGKRFTYSYVHTKCVCPACRIAFLVLHIQDSEEDVDSVLVEAVHALVEKDGEWLTPYDLWCERYKARHGHYPRDWWIG